MKKRLLGVLALLICSVIPTWAQNANFSGSAQSVDSFGVIHRIANATITVCATTGTGIPCTPVSSIFRSDGTALANPFTADGNGNFSFWAPSGNYQYTVTAVGITGQSFTISIGPGVANASTATALATVPTQCAANNEATGIAANGNANCIQPTVGSLAGLPVTQVQGGTGATSLAGANIPVQAGVITTGDTVKWASGTSIADAGGVAPLVSGTITTGDCVKWASGTSIADSGTTGCVALQVATPTAPTVTVNGTAGTTTYTYFVVAHDNTGGSTLVSASGSTTTGNATLSATNFNAVTWTAVTGAASYDVLKTNTATSLALNLACCSVNDTGQATAAYTAPGSNTTAYAAQTQPPMANGRYLAREPATSDAMQFVTAGGSDTNDGQSWGTAKLTLSAAVAVLPLSGGTIFVGAQTATWSTNQFASAPRNVTVYFQGRSAITVSATQVLPRGTVISCQEAFPFDQTAGTPSTTTFISTAAGNAFQVDAVSTVRGCAFQASGVGAGAGADFYVTANGNRWEHNVFDGKLYAINLDQSFNSNACNIYVESFLFNLFQSTSDNIHFTGPSVGSCEPGGGDVAIGNWFQKNATGETGGWGIFMPTSGGWGAGPISGNVFTGTSASAGALQLGGTFGAIVTGNDLEGFAGAGVNTVDGTSASNVVIQENNFGTDTVGVKAGAQGGNLVGPNNYLSTVTSPVIYAGANLGLTGNAKNVAIFGGPIAVGSASANFLATFDASLLTAQRTLSPPDATGTIALTSQLPLSGTVAGSITALAANSCGDTVTATITGATTSMAATASPQAAISAGLVLSTPFVSAANTVTVGYCNVTSASITPAAATFNIRVIQ